MAANLNLPYFKYDRPDFNSIEQLNFVDFFFFFLFGMFSSFNLTMISEPS